MILRLYYYGRLVNLWLDVTKSSSTIIKRLSNVQPMDILLSHKSAGAGLTTRVLLHQVGVKLFKLIYIFGTLYVQNNNFKLIFIEPWTGVHFHIDLISFWYTAHNHSNQYSARQTTWIVEYVWFGSQPPSSSNLWIV